MTTAEMMMTVEMMTAAAMKNSVESGEWRVKLMINSASLLLRTRKVKFKKVDIWE